MWNQRFSSRRANCIFRMPAQQVCHRKEIFFAGFVGGDGRKLCGDAMQVEICTPTAERARRFITDAGYQRQFKHWASHSPNSLCLGSSIQASGSWNETTRGRLNAVYKLAQRRGFRFGAVCHLSVIRHHVLQRRCSSDKLFHLPSSSPPESFCLNPHH